MALERVPDEISLVAELLRLQEEEQSLSDVRRRLHEQIDNGRANDLTIRRERKISDERRAVHARIDVLKAQLTILRGGAI